MLTECFRLQLVYRYMNPGIKYEYKLPLDIPVQAEESITPPLIRHHSHMSSHLGELFKNYTKAFFFFFSRLDLTSGSAIFHYTSCGFKFNICFTMSLVRLFYNYVANLIAPENQEYFRNPLIKLHLLLLDFCFLVPD